MGNAAVKVADQVQSKCTFKGLVYLQRVSGTFSMRRDQLTALLLRHFAPLQVGHTSVMPHWRCCSQLTACFGLTVGPCTALHWYYCSIQCSLTAILRCESVNAVTSLLGWANFSLYFQHSLKRCHQIKFNFFVCMRACVHVHTT